MSRPAFSSELRDRLATKYTTWALDLTEDELRNLLGMVGEFGVRAPEQYGGVGSGGNAVRREGALCGLVQFVRGNPVTLAQACEIGRRLGVVPRLDRAPSDP
jgi:hypothetical protein